MTSRWANPINNNILRDLEGTVLAGGDLEFYEAGTSTPLAVYSDSDLSVSLGSSITADSFGLIADFHMAAGTEYKMVAKDSGGTTKWTRDEVFSLDSSVDTRLDALESSIGSVTVSRNAFINSGCGKQRLDSNGGVVSAPSASSTFQIGTVAGHYGRATNVSAGTITRGTTTSVTSGYYLSLASITTTNSASVAEARFIVPSADAGRFQGTNGTITVLVYQDTGSAKDYTITAKKMDSEDDLSSLTTISTSGTTSVNSGSWTTLSYSVSAFGDCRNGLVFDISCACGVQTTKNYYFTMPMLDNGLIAATWTATPAANDRAGVQQDAIRYPLGYLSGYVMTAGADADHDLAIASGQARNSDDDGNIVDTSSLTKQFDATWAEGDAAGGMASSDHPISNWTTYNVYAIRKSDGTVDRVGATSESNALTDTSYESAAIVGAFWTDGSANIIGFVSKSLVGKKIETARFDDSYTGGWDAPSWLEYADVDVVGAGGSGYSGVSGNDGGDSVFDSYTAEGGSGGQSGAGGAGGLFASSTNNSKYTFYPGQEGSSAGGAGGESGLVSSYAGVWIELTGATQGSVFDAADGGGGSSNGAGGAGGGGRWHLRAYPLTTSMTLTVGAGGAAVGLGTAGADGLVQMRF